ncbi:MAG: sigma 54-interacting transcriptional regulator [Candidatus Eisenbacteria bacterium]|nr:sigma 54-interacting transcriptional regulator [Candidatus Eisenbacteria bacterium]MBU1950803.1 sigma 54-interacting transcriptional regulator [Candidatus Eisenbacteria bacterium]
MSRGDLFFEAGDLREAEACFAQALGVSTEESFEDLQLRIEKLGPVALPILRRWAQSLDGQGQFAQAYRLLLPAIPHLDEAEPLEAVRFQLVHGKLLMAMGRYEEAGQEALGGVNRLELLEAGKPVVEEGYLSNLLGARAFRQGQIPEASRWFRRALDVFKRMGRVRDMALAYNNLGQVSKRQSEWQQAVEYFQVARNLAATEGATRDRIGALLNLAYIRYHQGRLKTAQSDFEQAATEALQAGDAIRQYRAVLGGAQVARSRGDIPGAIRRIRSLSEIGLTSALREQLLAILEEGWIFLAEDQVEQVSGVLHRVSELMAGGSGWGGDLIGELRRLEAWMELQTGRPSKAQQLFEEAAELSRTAFDPVGQDAARLGLGVTLRKLQNHQASEVELRTLAERLRQRGERLSLGKALLELGHSQSAGNSSKGDALKSYEESTRIFQELGVPTLEAESWLAQGHACLENGDLEGSRVRLSLARETMPSTSEEGWVRQEKDLLTRLSKAFELRANSGHSGFDVFRKIESTFGCCNTEDVLECLRDVLGVVRSALDADAVLYGLLRGQKVEVFASRGMARLDGRRTLPLKSLIPDKELSPDRTRILVGQGLGLREGESGAEVTPSSALAVPVDLGDGIHLLYVERWSDSGRPHFQPGEGHYASALAMELCRGLCRRGWRRQLGLPPNLHEISRNIYLADIITQNANMFRILELINRIAPTDMTVLLQGETGTGKKLLAQAIHRVSRRSESPFVTVDCAALPESLLETELFGYRKGAFTGATQDREGLLGEADGGTIFLDEIGKSGIQVQRRFLHLLDSGEVRPVGATGYRRLDIRIVAATSSPDLSREVAEGRFLKDLYYRMNDITISVPPLRERKDDISLLAETFAEIAAERMDRKNQSLSPSLLQALVAHEWPGNVRELEKAIRRAVTLGEDQASLTPDLLPEEITGPKRPRISRQPLKDQLESVERDFILQALEQTGWNKSQAAKMLGLSRKGLRNKIERYHLDRRRR